jgi:hypothetical protein
VKRTICFGEHDHASRLDLISFFGQIFISFVKCHVIRTCSSQGLDKRGLNLEDLNNFKSDLSVKQSEGEDFRIGVRKASFRSGTKC